MGSSSSRMKLFVNRFVNPKSVSMIEVDKLSDLNQGCKSGVCEKPVEDGSILNPTLVNKSSYLNLEEENFNP
ncbi:hypothetical protein MA16_Dca019041 [Dendrobium catenatum]|uniref:Uncharacterized protein n=1 Tax=Dendrobium catenatum TaxID=906689 RepID=A0A2I0VHU4_9ASPA|nr:hypothetical protein MA16_Dca019041 [Dendrobium catenatum]